VLLVATHIDERSGGLPLEDLIERYSQIVGEWSVSNAQRDLKNNGIDRLREAIGQHAANLPLMGASWATSWWNATESIRSLKDGPDQFVSDKQLRDVMKAAKV
jgi:hypothetical protein